MINVTAATSFFGTRAEGMWPAGDTKRVSAHRANELIEAGLAIEARDQSEAAVTEPSTLQRVGFAINATPAEPADANLPAVADALGATIAADEIPAVTLEGMKQDKAKGKTKEEKDKHETKEAQ
jgi:hypothetical protein